MHSNGASAADIDSDGDIDLLVMSDGGDRLYANRGDGTFEDVTARAGIDVPERTLAVAWADLNHDRLLDPFFCTFFGAWEDADGDPAPDRLYLSDGAGGYVLRSDLAPGSDEASGCFAARFTDTDGDERLDLLTVHDKGRFFAPDRAFMNWDGGFSEEAGPRGLQQRHSGMGLALADFDSDGSLDVWKPSSPRDLLLLNDGSGSFIDASVASGLLPSAERVGSTWDVDAWDMDDDGDSDVLVLVSGYGEGEAAADHDHVFLNEGDGTFTFRRANDLGISGPSVTRSIGRADLDGDGAPDLILPEVGSGAAVYQGRCSGAGFVEVRVVGTHCARMAPGTRVRAESGGLAVEQIVTVGGEVQSSQPSELRFGLAGADQLDRLIVTFPCGARVEATSIDANSRVVVTEPDQDD